MWLLIKIKHTLTTMAPVEKSKRPSSAYNETITTKIGLKETEEHTVLFSGTLLNSAQLELFLKSYDVW